LGEESENAAQEAFNVCHKTYFTFDASVRRGLGYGAECARGRNVECWWFRKRRTNPNAEYVDTVRKHCDASRQHVDSDCSESEPDDTVHGSRLKFHKPSEPRQQHHAVYSETEHDSWDHSYGWTVRKFAGHAGRSQRLSDQSGFPVDFG
jgi:hypothetical protein